MTLRDDQLQLLEAFVDGRLAGDDLATAQRLVREDADAAALVAAASDADRAVRGLFPVPDEFEPSLPAAIPIGTAVPRVAPSRRVLRWAMAAALLLVATGAYFANFVFITSADSMYRDFVAAGFQPEWECKDEREFIEYSTARTGAPFLVAAAPGIKVMGWDSATDLITDKTVSLFAECDGTRVVVYVDQLADDRTPRMRPFSGMHLHRGQLGQTVFYEISPLDHPVILPLVHRPGEKPDMMIGEDCEDPPFAPRQYPSPASNGAAQPGGK